MIENFKKCFSINLKDYEMIGIDLQINKAILPGFVVFALLMVVLVVNRNKMRTLIVQLMRHDAVSQEKACTLEELGLANERHVKYLLSGSNMLKRIVKQQGAKTYSYEEFKALSKEEKKKVEKIDFAEARFYICEEQIDRARHIKEKYQMNKWGLIIGLIFLALIYIGLAASMPEILNLINNLLKRK